MIGKPFILENAIQDVVKASGGNKTIIAQQAQMGLIDPTSAVLAGMYIDRIREAEAAEKEQAATVAEQVFSPQPAPEAVSQMQLAQQGLGGAPTPAPKMPASVNMGKPQQPQMTAQMPRGMGATPQAAQMQAMQQKMAPRPSVAGMNQLPMGPGMIPRAASGGLLAFAGGGDVPGYAGGTENAIESFSNYQDFGMRDPIAEQNELRDRLLAGQSDYNFFDTYEMPDAPNMQDIYKEQEEYITSDLPKIDYDRVQQLVSPEAIAKKKAELEERTGQRFTGDLAVAALLGGAEAMKGQPSTGNVIGDVIGALGTAGTAGGPQIIQALRDKRAAEDKMFGMEEEAAFKQLALAGKEVENALKVKELVTQRGSEEARLIADERGRAVTGNFNARVAQLQKKYPGFKPEAAEARYKMLLNKAEAKGVPVTQAEKDNLRAEAYTYIASLSVIGALSRADQSQIAKVRKEVTDDVQDRLEMLESSGDWYDDPNYREDEDKFLRDTRNRVLAEVLASKNYGTIDDFNRTYAYDVNSLDDFMTGLVGKSKDKSKDKGASTETPSGTQNLGVGSIIEYGGVKYEILRGKKVRDIKTNKIYMDQGGKLVEVN